MLDYCVEEIGEEEDEESKSSFPIKNDPFEESTASNAFPNLGGCASKCRSRNQRASVLTAERQ